MQHNGSTATSSHVTDPQASTVTSSPGSAASTPPSGQSAGGGGSPAASNTGRGGLVRQLARRSSVQPAAGSHTEHDGVPQMPVGSPFAQQAAILRAASAGDADDGSPHASRRRLSVPPARVSLSRHASAEALARYSSLQRASVRSALSVISHFSALRDSAGPAFVDARNLIKVKDLGSGAYATVEHCQLANWQDPSQHGRRRSPPAATAPAPASPGAAAVAAAAEDIGFADDSAHPLGSRSGSGGSGSIGGSIGGNEGGNGRTGGASGGRNGGAAAKTHNSGRPPARLDVAVKHLRANLFECPADLEDFVKEAVLLAGLQHRSIVGVLGLGFSAKPQGSDSKVQESIFMVTELCSGGSLREKVLAQMVAGRRKVVYSYLQGLHWCAQVADGLAFLHAQSPLIIHRDVKLDNVLLTPDEDGVLEAKLADFGLHAVVEALDKNSLSKRLAALAQQQEAEEAGASAATAPAQRSSSDGSAAVTKVQRSNRDKERRKSGEAKSAPLKKRSRSDEAGTGLLSRVRSLVRSRGNSGAGPAPSMPQDDSPLRNLTGQTGSFLGMAPEVTLGQQYNEKADVFSLGCVITDVMAKSLTSTEVAFHGTVQEFQTYAMRVARGYRRELPASWPPTLARLVAACLAQRPADRPSAAEVASRLRGMQEAVAAMDGRRSGSGACCCLG